jgi:hypothetical protein
MSMKLCVFAAIALASSVAACASTTDRVSAGGGASVGQPAAETSVTTPAHCPSDWPIGAPVRHFGNPTPFSDRSTANEGC